MMEDDQDSDGAQTVAPSRRVKEEEEDGRKVKDHYCVECKRIFSSGKALGDHMNSAHAQSNRDFFTKKLKSKREFEAMNRVPSHVLDGDRIDSGHMVMVGFNESMKWQVTGKRGRAETKPVIDSASLPISDEIQAALQLVSLANGDSMKPNEDLDSKVKEGEATRSKFKGSRAPIKPVIGLSPFPSSEEFLRLINGDSKKPSEDLESKVKDGQIDDVNQDFRLNKNEKEVFSLTDERNSPVKNLKIFERADGNSGSEQFRRNLYSGNGKGKLNPGFHTENSTNGFKNPGDNPYEFGTDGSMMIKKISVNPELPLDFNPVGPEAESVPPAAMPAKYICSTCGKSFPTFHALGGHRSSGHTKKNFKKEEEREKEEKKKKKKKMKVCNTIDDTSSNGASSAKDGPKANAIKQLEVNTVKLLDFRIMLIMFHPTKLPLQTEKEDPKVLEFNLNELPDQDDEDGMEPGNTAR
ncbi:unnamed protein product [Fraxinus pennsylvanica]|uniref:C2H2-type domain-containing protein n=1 Tax=Fraxinus pennsylvanica TaxID=56036 RepID=A0AAD2ADT3_9LAMI|nr:unnamed protein product [Fraxinus pennsylvanica]